MKTKILFFFSIALLFAACGKVENNAMPLQCDESATDFKALYDNLANDANYQDDVTMDSETHSYDFEVSAPTTLCKIGYQSLPNFDSTPYEIELVDNDTGNILYFGSHLFSSAATSYEPIGPVLLQPGTSYTIKRIQTNWNGNIGNTIGRLVRNVPNNTMNGTMPFPIALGNLTITGSAFYGAGGPTDDFAIPFIDLVFE